MEENRSAAQKAITAEESALREEMLAKRARLAGEVSALETVLGYFMRIAEPDERAAVARQVRKMLEEEPAGPPSPFFDDAFEITISNLLARLDAP